MKIISIFSGNGHEKGSRQICFPRTLSNRIFWTWIWTGESTYILDITLPTTNTTQANQSIRNVKKYSNSNSNFICIVNHVFVLSYINNWNKLNWPPTLHYFLDSRSSSQSEVLKSRLTRHSFFSLAQLKWYWPCPSVVPSVLAVVSPWQTNNIHVKHFTQGLEIHVLGKIVPNSWS